MYSVHQDKRRQWRLHSSPSGCWPPGHLHVMKGWDSRRSWEVHYVFRFERHQTTPPAAKAPLKNMTLSFRVKKKKSLFSHSVMSSSSWPIDCRRPGFSVHGISQARTLEWVAISFSLVIGLKRVNLFYRVNSVKILNHCAHTWNYYDVISQQCFN